MLTSFQIRYNNYIINSAKIQAVSHSDTYLLLSFRINTKNYITSLNPQKFSRKNVYNFDTKTYLATKNNKKPYKPRLPDKK